MKVLLVSIDLEYSLTYAYLRAYALAQPELAGQVEFRTLVLDARKLGVYVDKNLEAFRLVEEVDATRPDLVCFSCYLWNHLPVRELSRLLRPVFPSLPILVGGPDVITTDAALGFMRQAPVDWVVRGEGEVTFGEFLAARLRGEDVQGIPGLSRRDRDCIVHDADRVPLRDLDRIPSPLLTGQIDLAAFDKVDEKGVVEPRRHRRYLLETYRGCYMKCAYCQWGDGIAARSGFSVERIRQEIEVLVSNRVKMVNVVDAMFGFSKRLAKEILVAIADAKRRHDSRTVFIGYHNQDFFDEELFDLYREAGFYPEIDLQSTNPEVLRLLGRGKWPTESFERHRHAFREHGVVIHDASDLIIGLPGDSYDSFRRSMNYFLERGIRVNLFHTSMLPSTRMWDDAEGLGLVYNPEPPRFVVSTPTFPIRDVARARRLGHGTELFQQYPRTMALLMTDHGRFPTPADLCEAFGDYLQERGRLGYEIGQYNRDYELITYQGLAQEFIEANSESWNERRRRILLEAFRFEAERKKFLHSRENPLSRPDHPLPAALGVLRFRLSRAVTVLDFDFDVRRVLEGDRLAPMGVPSLSGPIDLDSVPEVPVSIFFFKGPPHEEYAILSRTGGALARRMNGYFTLRECHESYVRELGESPAVAPLDPEVEEDVRFLYALGILEWLRPVRSTSREVARALEAL